MLALFTTGPPIDTRASAPFIVVFGGSGMNLGFHHVGVPVDKSQISSSARYSPAFKMYTDDAKNDLEVHIQYHAFDKRCPLNDAIKNQVHVAFKTENIEQILEGNQVIMPLYEPFKGYKCAMILVNGLPIELIETSLSEKEIWSDSETLKTGILYGK